MIGVDRLQQISGYLDRASNDGDDVLRRIRDYLNAVYESAEYQNWLAVDQYLGDRSLKGLPPAPREASEAFPEAKHLLTEHALVANGSLQVKVDRHFDRVHVTDGFWCSPIDRVFPTCDESELVCDFIKKNIAPGEDLYLIDPACGSGHHALGLKDMFPRRSSFDISGRALAFARFNSILNGDSRHLVAYGDIKDGICDEVVSPLNARVVFAVNMPFAIPPERKVNSASFSFSQDGGDRGSELTLAALKAVHEFSSRDRSFASLDAVVLCYSLGREDNDGNWVWEVNQFAKSQFQNCLVEFTLLANQKLWRVNGRKEQPNPMPIESIALKADCVHTFSESVRATKRASYLERAVEFRNEGYTHLGYGIIHIRKHR